MSSYRADETQEMNSHANGLRKNVKVRRFHPPLTTGFFEDRIVE